MRRRTFLSLSSITALALLTGCEAKENTTLKTFNNKLPIPELLKPTTRNGVKHYDLDVQEAKHTFFKGIQTDTYAINSTYLGPTLLMQDGDKVSINYKNNL